MVRYKLDPFSKNGVSVEQEPKIIQSTSHAMPGRDGTNGVGVPTGGTTGQVLKKSTDGNYDTEWGTVAGTGIVETIVAGTNVTVDSSDPANPIVGSTGGGSFTGTMDDITDGATYVKTHNDYTDAEQTKLSGIEAGANNYTHPATHSADIITDGTTNKAYTATEKTKLSGIATGAEVNVQADWNQATNTADDYIKNKPTIPDQLSDLSDDTTHRLVTDTEKSTWNAKQNALVADTDYLTPGTAAITYQPAGTYSTDIHSNITALNAVSGTNTGDQDLSGYSLTSHNHTGVYAPVLGADDNYVTDAEKIVIGNTSGTNTGDQTLPVKASAAELDTGTDDDKFSTAKALKDSHNVPSVAPGASGNLLTSNGTDWTSAAKPSYTKSDVGLGNVDNTSDATKLAATLLAVYPVGSIYTSVSSTNPGTLFGGTWSAFGAGKVLVGLDSGDTDFDTVEETGGSKTHTLSVAEMPAHKHSLTGYATPSSTGTHTGQRSGNPTAYTTDVDVANTGGGGAHNNLQPYIVVYMFKRTA